MPSRLINTSQDLIDYVNGGKGFDARPEYAAIKQLHQGEAGGDTGRLVLALRQNATSTTSIDAEFQATMLELIDKGAKINYLSAAQQELDNLKKHNGGKDDKAIDIHNRMMGYLKAAEEYLTDDEKKAGQHCTLAALDPKGEKTEQDMTNMVRDALHDACLREADYGIRHLKGAEDIAKAVAEIRSSIETAQAAPTEQSIREVETTRALVADARREYKSAQRSSSPDDFKQHVSKMQQDLKLAGLDISVLGDDVDSKIAASEVNFQSGRNAKETGKAR